MPKVTKVSRPALNPSINELVDRSMLPERNAVSERYAQRQMASASLSKGPSTRFTAPKAKRSAAVAGAVRRGAIRP